MTDLDTKSCLIELVHLLSDSNAPFFLSGGILAGLYRQNKRASGFAEFAVTEELRSNILKWCTTKKLSFRGLRFSRGAINDKDVLSKNPPVISITSTSSFPFGVDFVFDNPFLEIATERESFFTLDEVKVPTFDPELFVLYRFLLLGLDSGRFLDEDDLLDIASREHFVDWAYVLSIVEKQQIVLPEIVTLFPAVVNRIFERAKKNPCTDDFCKKLLAQGLLTLTTNFSILRLSI